MERRYKHNTKKECNEAREINKQILMKLKKVCVRWIALNFSTSRGLDRQSGRGGLCRTVTVRISV